MERAMGVVEDPDPLKIGLIVLAVVLLIAVGVILFIKTEDDRKPKDKKVEQKENANTQAGPQTVQQVQPQINPVQPK